MPSFQVLSPQEDPKEVIQSAFSTVLDISGGWGYTQDLATHINASASELKQLEHMFASMRATLEMNMTQAESTRYASINLKEHSREEIVKENEIFYKVTYEITAIQETQYKHFIQEYKENYGKATFNLAKHFEARKAATLHREVIHWFKPV